MYRIVVTRYGGDEKMYGSKRGLVSSVNQSNGFNTESEVNVFMMTRNWKSVPHEARVHTADLIEILWIPCNHNLYCAHCSGHFPTKEER